MSISIGSGSLLNTTSSLQASSSTSKLEDKLKTNLKDSKDEELLDACKSFESYLVQQVFKEMKKTVPESEDESQNNEYVKSFEDMLYQSYADDVTEGEGLGIAKMLYESMKR